MIETIEQPPRRKRSQRPKINGRKDTIDNRLYRLEKASNTDFLAGFVLSYLDTALSIDQLTDSKFRVLKLSHAAFDSAQDDCTAWVEQNRDLIKAACNEVQGMTNGCLAHDFFMARNSFGDDFSQRGYSESICSQLMEAAQAFGPRRLFSHQGKLYW